MANSESQSKTQDNAQSATGSQTSSQSPFPDIQKIIEQFKVPGVDMNKIIEAQRKDIEAVVEANKKAYEGMQALAQRQSEMLKQAMTEWQSVMQEVSGKDLAQNASKQADFARQAFEKTLSNMRELAEMATSSQREALDVIYKRFQENLAALKTALQSQ